MAELRSKLVQSLGIDGALILPEKNFTKLLKLKLQYIYVLIVLHLTGCQPCLFFFCFYVLY